MKTLLFAACLMMSGLALADQYVSPYIRQDGTIVQQHFRSSPNNTAADNYSTRGNTNPYTRQEGTVTPPPQSNSYGGGYVTPPSYNYGYRR